MARTKTTRAERLKQAAHERREQEKQELREAILTAASQLFLKHGYADFSLREVAEHVGYSPGTIYLYFKDKDDLLFQVADVGFAKFGAQLAAASASCSDPMDRLAAMARAYINFGLNNPAHYELMFIHRTDYLIDVPEEKKAPRVDSFAILQRTVEDALAQNAILPGDPVDLSNTLWCTVHGIVALAIEMEEMFPPERIEPLVEMAVGMMRKGLQPE